MFRKEPKCVLGKCQTTANIITVQKNTMAAFKGFEEKSIEQIRTVQDIGSLILYSM